MTRDFAAGNYRFIPAVFQYSSGAAASSGFEIERVRFDSLVPLAEGFAAVAKYIAGRGTAADLVLRLRVALAGGVHRGWLSRFNQHYVKTLAEWGLFDGTDQSRRAQQCLPGDRPAQRAVVLRVLVHPAEQRHVADLRHCRRRGSARRHRQLSRADRALPRSQPGRVEGEGRFTVRRNGAPARRVRFRLERHHGGAGLHRARFSSGCRRRTGAPGATRSGLTWHFARPPVVDLEFEMDCRRVIARGRDLKSRASLALASRRVTLHAARIGGGAAAAADFRGGGEAAFRPVGAGLDDVAAALQRHRRSPSARGFRPPARRAARCAARTKSGNARNARPARRSLPADSCLAWTCRRKNCVIHWSCWSPPGEPQARYGSPSRSAMVGRERGARALARRQRGRDDFPRARTSARGCRGRSRVPGSPARIAASRRTASPKSCCRPGR